MSNEISASSFHFVRCVGGLRRSRRTKSSSWWLFLLLQLKREITLGWKQMTRVRIQILDIFSFEPDFDSFTFRPRGAFASCLRDPGFENLLYFHLWKPTCFNVLGESETGKKWTERKIGASAFLNKLESNQFSIVILLLKMVFLSKFHYLKIKDKRDTLVRGGNDSCGQLCWQVFRWSGFISRCL